MGLRLRIITCVIALLIALVALPRADSAQKHDKIIVNRVLSVTYKEEEANPTGLLVEAIGEVPTAGYTNTQLVRVVYVTPPSDGVQDYILYSTPPTGPVPQLVSQVKASNTWKAYLKEAPWIKGVRVHGIGNGVVTRMFTKGDLALLQGTWTPIKSECDGDQTPPDELKKIRLIYKQQSFIVLYEGEEIKRGDFSIDETKTPKHMDVTGGHAFSSRRPMLGIYEIKGDELKVCFSVPGASRPTVFATKPNTGLTLEIYTRTAERKD